MDSHGAKLCDGCLEVTSLLQTYDPKRERGCWNTWNDVQISSEELATIVLYMQSWTQSHCTCCFRDVKNLERWSWAVRILILAVVEILRHIRLRQKTENEDVSAAVEFDKISQKAWDIADKEKLVQFVAKVFLSNFPLYLTKHHGALRNEEIAADSVGNFFDISEVESPYLVQNLVLFCHKADGLAILSRCTENQTPETLSIRHLSTIVTLGINVKSWLNFPSLLNFFVPFRRNLLGYVGNLVDTDHAELKTPSGKNLIEYIWTAVKDPVDSHLLFDKEGFDLALKFLRSSTLTMRLAGMVQITTQVNLVNEFLNSSHVGNVTKNIAEQLTSWILENKLIEHIFGPNLHVEIVKHTHTIIAFLGLEGKISKEHIDIIWQAAALKHCSKQVFDVLSSAICSLDSEISLYLKSLLSCLQPQHHTDQTILLASALQKYIWSNMKDAPLVPNLRSVVGAASLVCSESKKSGQEGLTETVDKNNDFTNMLTTREEFIAEVNSRKDIRVMSDHDHSSEDGSSVGDSGKSDDFDESTQLSLSGNMETHSDSDADGERSGNETEESMARTKRMLRKKRKISRTPLAQDIRKETVESSAVISELSSLVQMTPYISPLQQVADISDDGSSSRLSNKNMADFEGEDSGDDDLSLNASQLAKLAPSCTLLGPVDLHPFGRTRRQTKNDSFDIQVDRVCQSNETVLWDLLQDEKIVHLPDGLAIEVQRVFTNLLCYNASKVIRLKFIEGCIDNISCNRSALMCLRLLPKLLMSFQSRNHGDIHQITLWAEKEHDMLNCFFKNLRFIREKTSHLENQDYFANIQVGLEFLSVVFSAFASPTDFRLTLSQIDDLWNCLAEESKYSEHFFVWLISQLKTKDQHALSEEVFRHIFNRKLPSLAPELVSMQALNLFQQLCNVARNSKEEDREAALESVHYLWKIALFAKSTDVSMTAIHYLNDFYMSPHLEKEDEFIDRCMTNLVESANELTADNKNDEEELLLLRIQRGLLLLKAHIEAFRKRYAYHMRKWQLEGNGIGCHSQLVGEISLPLKIVIQPAGYHEKVTFELQPTDVIADLRAEVSNWWDSVQKSILSESPRASQGDCASTDGPIRMITQGIELSAEYDEKCLSELIRDNQLIYVSIGGKCQKKKDSQNSLLLPPPSRDKLPVVLLLEDKFFEQLFDLMRCLTSLRLHDQTGVSHPHTKAQVLSRRVWDIIMLLPTNPRILDAFVGLHSNSFSDFLDPLSTQKLMYSLYIVEALVKVSPANKFTGAEFKRVSFDANTWKQQFIEKGGLVHLFEIFISGCLEPQTESSGWNEWKQDCLACLLKILCFLGIVNDDTDCLIEQLYEQNDFNVTRRKSKRIRLPYDKLQIPRLNEAVVAMMNTHAVIERLTNIFLACSVQRDFNHYKTGFWGRAQVVRFALSMLICWAFSSEQVRPALYAHTKFSTWLKQLILDDPDPVVRGEASTGLSRLSLCILANSEKNGCYTSTLIAHLLKSLSSALNMKPQEKTESYDDEKDVYGQTNRDYFWLLCRLLDNDFVKENSEDIIDLNELSYTISKLIISREYLEIRHCAESEDTGLVGMLNMCTVLMKHNPPFKAGKDGQHFLTEVFDCLFALPSPQMRYLPKCKSHNSRVAAFDLLNEMVKQNKQNYYLLQNLLMEQQQRKTHIEYPWDYWPRENERSSCGFVGLSNLGATCYLNNCIQHIFLLPTLRHAILTTKLTSESKHETMFKELQRMFAFLLESERKTFKPKNFCKAYLMDNKPLNTGEQKDMAEFFIDLVSKLEEVTPELKKLVKYLLCGTLSNNVVSLDCDHSSCQQEEFYVVRCQVANMKNIFESLNEITLKDTLDGDNMYTCSQCSKKVRAEKRACFKKLPKILCFNVMRYSFNMVTMTKEKVNTHFSFPLLLDMSEYTEKNMMPKQYREEKEKSSKEANIATSVQSEIEDENFKYDLIGISVHTGTAEGGHYYSFIRDIASQNNKWLFFNDAEVKSFDSSQIPAECFGGEMNTKTYDSLAEKFMDFSFEKTHSAYMLFYERRSSSSDPLTEGNAAIPSLPGGSCNKKASIQLVPKIELNQELMEWMWSDNIAFLSSKNIFEHTYFNFMWQMCNHIPQSLGGEEEVTLLATKLALTFFLETLIHSKERPTLVQWVELLTKQLQASPAAAAWFLDYMTEHIVEWPQTILLKCSNQMVRQMFQRLLMHVVQHLRSRHLNLYLKQPDSQKSDHPDETNLVEFGSYSCVTRFLKSLLTLLEHGAKNYLKHLAEIFTFLHDFCKLGDEECLFFINIQAITKFVNFYLGDKKDDSQMESNSEAEADADEEDEEVASISSEKYKILSLEKMIAMVAILVEKSRDDSNALRLSANDWNALTGNDSFAFIVQQIRDSINLQSTRNLIFSMCRWNENLADKIVTAIFDEILKRPDASQPFFKILQELCSSICGLPPGMANFTDLICQHLLDVREFCPQLFLEWLTQQAPRNKIIHSWSLASMNIWLENLLIGHPQMRVRNAAATLLISLVPNPTFRQSFRSTKLIGGHSCREISMSFEALNILHEIYLRLLDLLKPARYYIDTSTHGTCKLTSYFGVMTFFTISKKEKIMFGPYFENLWQLFHCKMSEAAIGCFPNKQALLQYWFHVCNDCPENIQRILHNPFVTKQIAFNYILADHDDQEVILFNRMMLPAYFGILRLCCQASRPFAGYLSLQKNIMWALKNICVYPNLYPLAVEELLKMMSIFVTPPNNASEADLTEISLFKRQALQLFLHILDGRTNWPTLISVFRILVETFEDKLFVVCNNGLGLLFEAFHTIHLIHHEAAGCHVFAEILDLLSILVDILRSFRPREFLHTTNIYAQEIQIQRFIADSKEWPDVLKKLSTLLNTFSPSDLRCAVIETLVEFLYLMPSHSIRTLVPLMVHCHSCYLNNNQENCPSLLGSCFPRRVQHHNQTVLKPAVRPPKAILQMSISQLGQDLQIMLKDANDDFENQVREFYSHYHSFVDTMCRIAFMKDLVCQELATLSLLIGIEELALNFSHFPKLWLEVYNTPTLDRKNLFLLVNSPYFGEYVQQVMLNRTTLTNIVTYNFLCSYIPKAYKQLICTSQMSRIATIVVTSLENLINRQITDVESHFFNVLGDVKALMLIYSSVVNKKLLKNPLPPPAPSATQIFSLLQTLYTFVEAKQTSHVQVSQLDGHPSRKRKLNNRGDVIDADNSDIKRISTSSEKQQLQNDLINILKITMDSFTRNIANIMEHGKDQDDCDQSDVDLDLDDSSSS